jgi:dipeptidase E
MEPRNSLFRRKAAPGDIHEQLLSMDLIYVGGGSLLNLLAVWRAHGVDDGVALLFAGDRLAEVVSARPGAGAYWVEETVETPLEARPLPAGPAPPARLARAAHPISWPPR